MNINNLVERIEGIRWNVESESNNTEIFEWLSDCQVFLENNHKKLEYTIQFIAEKETFKSSIIDYKSYMLSRFDSLAATIKSVKKIEDARIEQDRKNADFIRELNS